MLTVQQKKFGQEFINKRDSTKAALAAGVAPKFAKKIGKEWIENPEIQRYINDEIEKSCEKTKITREWIMTEARKCYETSSMPADKRESLKLLEMLISKEEVGGKGDTAPQININCNGGSLEIL